MSTENNLKDLSKYVYYIDPKHDKYDPRIKKSEEIELKNIEYQILKIEDNTSTVCKQWQLHPLARMAKPTHQKW